VRQKREGWSFAEQFNIQVLRFAGRTAFASLGEINSRPLLLWF
jgi:hypothetical protein